MTALKIPVTLVHQQSTMQINTVEDQLQSLLWQPSIQNLLCKLIESEETVFIFKLDLHYKSGYN